MRKLCFGILELVLLSALSTIEGPQLSADVYPGPAGLDWRRGPADAKIILSNRFQFINERSFKDEPLDTIVQYYSGDFGGLPTRQIKALFYRGSFFYLAVEVLPSAATSKSFFHIEELMSGRHGSPKLITKPRSIQSKATMLSHIQSAGKRPGLVDLTLKDKFAAFDLQIQTGLLAAQRIMGHSRWHENRCVDLRHTT